MLSDALKRDLEIALRENSSDSEGLFNAREAADYAYMNYIDAHQKSENSPASYLHKVENEEQLVQSRASFLLAMATLAKHDKKLVLLYKNVSLALAEKPRYLS